MTETIPTPSPTIVHVPTALSLGLNASELHQIGEILHRNWHNGRVQRVLSFERTEKDAARQPSSQQRLTAPHQDPHPELDLELGTRLNTESEPDTDQEDSPTGQELAPEGAQNESDIIPPSYIAKVVAIYRQESETIRRLQGQDSDAWRQLHDKLKEVAYRILLGLSDEHEDAIDKAEDYAQIACGKILRALYPFDVEFRFWCVRILRNAIFEDRRTKANKMETSYMVDSLDRLVESNESFAVAPLYEPPQLDFHALLTRPEVEQWETVRSAIEQIGSEARRLVIQYTYFDGLEDSEIATALGRSIEAIYSLRHRALKQLKQILASMGVTKYE